MPLTKIPRASFAMHHLDSLYRLWVQPHHQPHFQCYSKQVTILQQPIDFYIQLHQGIRGASRRIVLSSLYLGTGNLEKYLVHQMDNKIKRCPTLRLTTLMDYNRSMRIDSLGQSAADILRALKSDNSQNANVKVAFFKQPHGIALSKQVRQLSGENAWYMLQEIMGVHHMKYYIFDDQVILTGANLSASYFTDRHDRWVVLDAVPHLADYLEDITNCLANNSIQVDAEDQWAMPMNQPLPSSFSPFTKILKHHFKMLLFGKKVKVHQEYLSHFGIQEHSVVPQEEGTKVERQMSKEQSHEVAKLFEQSRQIAMMTQERKERAKEILEQSFDQGDVANIVRRIEEGLYKKKEQGGELMDMGEKVFIFPVFQVPCIQYYKDQELFSKLLKHISTQDTTSRILLASGYMNFDKEVQQIVQKIDTPMELLTAAPMANSFYQAGRVKSWIPYLYRQMQWQIQKGLHKNTKVLEWQKQDSTFHSKGLWAVDHSGTAVPLTIIGSSNFSHRSYYRDTECSFYIVSMCPDLNHRFYQEAERQYQDAVPITPQESKNKDGVSLGIRSYLLAKLLKSFL